MKPNVRVTHFLKSFILVWIDSNLKIRFQHLNIYTLYTYLNYLLSKIYYMIHSSYFRHIYITIFIALNVSGAHNFMPCNIDTVSIDYI